MASNTNNARLPNLDALYATGLNENGLPRKFGAIEGEFTRMVTLGNVNNVVTIPDKYKNLTKFTRMLFVIIFFITNKNRFIVPFSVQ